MKFVCPGRCLPQRLLLGEMIPLFVNSKTRWQDHQQDLVSRRVADLHWDRRLEMTSAMTAADAAMSVPIFARHSLVVFTATIGYGWGRDRNEPKPEKGFRSYTIRRHADINFASTLSSVSGNGATITPRVAYKDV